MADYTVEQIEAALKAKQSGAMPSASPASQPKVDYSTEQIEAALKAKQAGVKPTGTPTPQGAASSQSPLNMIGQSVLGGVKAAGDAYEKYGSAPLRSGIGAIQDNKNPLAAIGRQFGQDPKLAPTGDMIADKAGFQEKPPLAGMSNQTVDQLSFGDPTDRAQLNQLRSLSPRGTAGAVIEQAADPMIVAGVAGKGLGLVAKGARAVGASGVIDKGVGLVGKGVSKVAEAFTGVPDQQIRTYWNQTKEVNKLIKDSGGDITVAADQVRTKLQDGIRQTRQQLSAKISKALEAAPKDKTISIQPVLDKLNEWKGKLNPNYKSDAISQIDDMILKIQKANPDGMTNIQGLQEMKMFLQDEGSSAFYKGGQIFTKAREAEIAAKNASTEALNILNPLAPEIRQANGQLSQLHTIEKNLNKNLLAPGKPDSAIIAAGSGSNNRNTAALNRLGKLTGQDPVGEAQKLASAKTFANPPLMPMDTTGKAALRTGAGYAIGKAASAFTNIPGLEYVAAALTSPTTLKLAINAGKIPVDIIKKFTGAAELSDDVILKAYTAAQTPKGATTLEKLLKGDHAVPESAVQRRMNQIKKK